MTANGIAQESVAQAARLELRADTALLLRFLLDGGSPTTDIGRYEFLSRVLERRPTLRTALASGNAASTGGAWADTLAAQSGELQFLHGLAVLYFEEASRRSAVGETSESYWVVGTALWVLVLSSTLFWSEFWAGRTGNVDADVLLDECLQSVLAVHSTAGRQRFTAGSTGRPAARIHLRCLDMCRKGRGSLTEELRRFGVGCDLPVDGSRLGRAQKLAGDLVDEWAKGLVREAERSSTDPEAVQGLAEGLRKNYEGGIDHLSPFIDLGVADLSVLRSTLGWYNEWCFDLHVKGQSDDIDRLMARAAPVADQLATLCDPKNSYLPENAALSQHFLLTGFFADDPQLALEHYEVALEWDRSNTNAEELLEGQRREARRGRRLTDALIAGDWATAERELRRILAEPGIPAEERRGLEKELSGVLNAMAVALVEQLQRDEVRFGDALSVIVDRVKRRPEVRG